MLQLVVAGGAVSDDGTLIQHIKKSAQNHALHPSTYNHSSDSAFANKCKSNSSVLVVLVARTVFMRC